MKILQLTYALSSGGAERFLVDLSNELCNRKDTEVVLVMVEDQNKPELVHYLPDLDKRVKFICAGCKSGYHWRSFFSVLKIIRQEKPNVVHAHCGSMLLYLPAFFLRKTAYVHTLHNLAEKCLNNHAQYMLNRWFYKRLIKPVTISLQCQLSYEKLYGKGRATQITNGRSPIVASSKLSDVKIELSQLGITETDKIFIHVARCTPQKNQSLLFESFKTIASKRHDIQLIVLGHGFEGSEFMQYDGKWNIHILGERNNVGDYMLCSHFFILSSNYEGLPISLLEAMSCGLIPVSTSVGGVPDVVENGRNGFLSPSLSQKDFESTILRALANGETINREAIKREYAEKYSMTACAAKYYAVYEDVINNYSR